MKYLSLPHNQRATVDDKDYKKLSQYTWNTTAAGYVKRDYQINGKRMSEYLHRAITGAKKGQIVDHINGDTLNNRRSNLRLCTQAENMMNRGKTVLNTSGYKGVTRYRGKWLAQIGFTDNTKRHYIHIAKFSTPLEAAQAYDAVAVQIGGAFARLNEVV